MDYNKIYCEKCQALLAIRNKNGWYEVKHTGKNISIVFPHGLVKCSKCNVTWLINPYIPNNDINYLQLVNHT
jgi:hypothetical protein